MTDIGFFIWQMRAMPDDPGELALLCKRYGITRLAIKLLNGSYKYNVPLGDRPLKDYIAVLRENGIEVEGWGYHYPDSPGAQGEAIEERRQEFELTTYHLDIEGEWKRPSGMVRAINTLLGNVKKDGFEVLLCSCRFPALHNELPWDAAMNHAAIDGASPQVYFALKHNPAEQLSDTFEAYGQWNKPVYPIGPTFGANFRWGDEVYYWEPTVNDLIGFRVWCEARRNTNIPRIYYYSLDWLLSKKRYDWLEAATGCSEPPPPPPPPPPGGIEPVCSAQILAHALNLRSMSNVHSVDLGNILRGSILPVVERDGDWLRVEGWIYGGNDEWVRVIA